MRRILAGPAVPYAGRQRSEVFLASGTATATVAVESDGPGRTRREFVTGAGAGTVVLTLGKLQWMRRADGRWVRLPDAPGASDLPSAVQATLRNYDVQVGAKETVAGRPAVRVRLVHRRAFDPSREVWVDAVSGAILRDKLLAPDGRVRSLSEFTQFAPRKPGSPRLRPPTSAVAASQPGPASLEPRVSVRAVERETGRFVHLPAYVPAGYAVVHFGVMHTGSGRLMPAVRYSNGLAAFTVFQRGSGQGMGLGQGPGGRRRGRAWRGGRGAAPARNQCVGQSDLQASVVVVTGTASNYLLVGDLAESELMRVGKSLP